MSWSGRDGLEARAAVWAVVSWKAKREAPSWRVVSAMETAGLVKETRKGEDKVSAVWGKSDYRMRETIVESERRFEGWKRGVGPARTS